MPEPERPGKVLFVVLTDGEENSSRRYSQMMIADRIEHQRKKYGWEFVFLGANQDAIMTARGPPIPTRAAMSYTGLHQGVFVPPIGALNNFAGTPEKEITASLLGGTAAPRRWAAL